jgi:hypothetical protein
VGERAQFEPLLRAFGVNPDKYPASFWPWWQQASYKPNQQHGTVLTTEGHSQPGGLIWRPFEGLPPDTDPKAFLGHPGWDYVGFLENIVTLLNRCVDTAIYVHCQLGADRTGAFHIGYLMLQHGLTLEEATAEANASTSAGPPNADYQRLVAAYAATHP